jgi:hypothetical protein
MSFLDTGNTNEEAIVIFCRSNIHGELASRNLSHVCPSSKDTQRFRPFITRLCKFLVGNADQLDEFLP